MKTFKLVDLNVERVDKEEQSIEQFPLIDGLIINKEDGENHWLIEALVQKEHLSFFEQLQNSQSEAKVFVTITKKKQSPRPADSSSEKYRQAGRKHSGFTLRTNGHKKTAGH